MSRRKYTEEFKTEAVKQIKEEGHALESTVLFFELFQTPRFVDVHTAEFLSPAIKGLGVDSKISRHILRCNPAIEPLKRTDYLLIRESAFPHP